MAGHQGRRAWRAVVAQCKFIEISLPILEPDADAVRELVGRAASGGVQGFTRDL
jgi:hypothetical protein